MTWTIRKAAGGGHMLSCHCGSYNIGGGDIIELINDWEELHGCPLKEMKYG